MRKIILVGFLCSCVMGCKDDDGDKYFDQPIEGMDKGELFLIVACGCLVAKFAWNQFFE